ncbi:MAG: heavy metal-associated domain-containing protein [Anaerolineaceae bacterium]
MSIITFQIANIHCDHCVHTIQSELSELEGVIKAVASLETKSVTIEYEPPATLESIKALLAEINYAVVG